MLKRDPGYYTVIKKAEEIFMENFICPHKEVAPYLNEYYAAACKEEMPEKFIFT